MLKKILWMYCLLWICILILGYARITIAAITFPKETYEYLDNPGIGWMTMYGPAIHNPPIPSGVKSTIYYYRPCWSWYHLGENRYDWARMDAEIQAGIQGGQQMMIRFMPVSEECNPPEWMKNDARFNKFYFTFQGHQNWVVDLEDPDVQQQVSKFIQEFAKRYDRHPGFYAMEISFLGYWGEGHFWASQPTVPIPNKATLEWLVDEHYKNFKYSPVIAPVDSCLLYTSPSPRDS